MVVKYRVNEIAKDFKKTPQDISDILLDFLNIQKERFDALDNNELDIIFEVLTQKHQVDNFNPYFQTQRPIYNRPTQFNKTNTTQKVEKTFVFISYSTQNGERAEQIRRILEKNNISYWMAPQSIPAGSDYSTEIPEAISKCSVFLLLLSQESQTSSWVPKEIGLAIDNKKTIIPLQIDDAPLTKSFNFYLTNCQRINAHKKTTDAYQVLIDALKKCL